MLTWQRPSSETARAGGASTALPAAPGSTARWRLGLRSKGRTARAKGGAVGVAETRSRAARQIYAVLGAVPAGRVPAAVDRAGRGIDSVCTVVVGRVLLNLVGVGGPLVRGSDADAAAAVPAGV